MWEYHSRTPTPYNSSQSKKIDNNIQEQDKIVIYELTCNTCYMLYIGQMSRSLKQRYQECIRYIKHNEPQPAYAIHILNNKQEYGPINDTMILLKCTDKTTLLISYEQLYIISYHQHKQLIPEQHLGEHDTMYQLIYSLHNMSRLTRPTEQHKHN
jgi:hypothetical protein